jgi:uncharacterized protein
MKLVDLNVLLYAIHRQAPQHEKVRRWWEAALPGDEPIGLAWPVIAGFLRLSTSARVFVKPLAPGEAIERVDAWLAHPNTHVVCETEEHWRIFRELLEQTGTAGNLTTDAHLAALAISLGAKVASCDADFGRFPGLRWENPAA